MSCHEFVHPFAASSSASSHPNPATENQKQAFERPSNHSLLLQHFPIHHSELQKTNQKLQGQEAGGVATVVEVEGIAERVIVEAEALLALPCFPQLPPYLRPEPPVEASKPPLPSCQRHPSLSHGCHHCSNGHGHPCHLTDQQME